MSLLKKKKPRPTRGVLPLSASAASMVLIAATIVLQPRWSIVASSRSTPVVVTIVVVPVSTASTSISTEIASVVVVEIALMSGRSSIASIVATVVHPCWRRWRTIPEVVV